MAAKVAGGLFWSLILIRGSNSQDKERDK